MTSPTTTRFGAVTGPPRQVEGSWPVGADAEAGSRRTFDGHLPDGAIQCRADEVHRDKVDLLYDGRVGDVDR
jgi:hypothetical protein